MADDPTAVLELRHIEKSFGDLTVLRDVSLTVPPGSATAVVGPSGAGKSTLLHIAGLMETPSAGLVRIHGDEMGDMTESGRAARRLDVVGFLFQFHYLLPDFNVLENALIPARIANEDLRAAERRARDLLERLGLKDRLTHRPSELSGGEQQRAALARSLARRPKLLLCDEPTGNLDVHTGRAVMELVWEEISRQGLGAVIVTHNEEIANRAARRLHLRDGRFVENDEEIRDA